METGNILIGLAQIGVALAGFTTIASVIVNTSVTTSRNLFIVRVLSVLTFSLSMTFAALAPILVNTADISGNRLWQVSAILIQPLMIFAAVIGFGYITPRAIGDSKNNWAQTIMSILLGSTASICGIIAIFSDQAELYYMLLIMLTFSGAIFMVTTLILSFPVFELLFAKQEKPVKNSQKTK